MYNRDTKRWVKKDGVVGKRILEKKKEKKEQDKKDEKDRKERKREREEAQTVQDALESEVKRLKILAVPSLETSSYDAPCVHGWGNVMFSFGLIKRQRFCKICGKEWKLIVMSESHAKESRFVSVIHNLDVVAGVSPYMDKLTQKEVHEAHNDLASPLRRVGESGLSSGLTGDFRSMSVEQKDVRKKGQAGAGRSSN